MRLLLAHTTLEQVLQAVAQDRTLIADLKSLVGQAGDLEFGRFLADLDRAWELAEAEFHT